MKFSLLILFICFSGFYSLAQSDYELSKLINLQTTKAPEASAIQRYGDIPVNYATGVPNISFPLYEINAGGLKIPITLSYHASGIKVSDVATSVGLGFNLSSGGRINRLVIDKEDGSVPLPLNFKTPQQYNSARDYLYQNAANAYDPKFQELYDKLWYDKTYCDRMSDRYSLFLPNGINVVFRKNFTTGEFVQTPYEGLKIEYLANGFFKIIDKDGTIYHFSNTDSYGWNLTKIENADKTDFIDFYYGTVQANTSATYPSFFEESGGWINAWPALSGNADLVTSGTGVNRTTGGSSSQQQLGQINNLVTKISNNNLEVNFNYVGGRLDPASLKLSDITVIDLVKGNQIRKVVFNYTNFGIAAEKTWRLKLSSFEILSSDTVSGVSQKYSFGYYENQILPPYYDLNYHHFFHEDFWGYYNGSNSINRIPAEIALLDGAGRYPNPEFAIACSLKEVTYPTGGKTVYELEGNFGMQYQAPFYGEQGNIGYGSGLRIKTIKNYTNAGTLAETKTFIYTGTSLNSIGRHLYSYDKRYFFRIDPSDLGGIEKTRTITISEPMESLSIGENPPIIYDEVKVYNGTVNSNLGYTSYQYSFPPRQETNPYELDIHQKHAWQWDYGQESPLLSRVLTYKRNTADPSGYTLIKEEINEYTPFKQNKFQTGINIIENTTYRSARAGGYLTYFQDFPREDPGMEFTVGPINIVPENFGAGMNKYFYTDNIIATETSGYTASHLLTKKTEIVLASNGNLTNIVNYEYDPSTLQLKNQQTTNSKNEVLKTEFKYPSDFITQEPYQTMVNTRNSLSPIIETKQFNGSSLLKLMKTNYGFWNANALIKPTTMELKMGAFNPEIKARYYSYDVKGNPLSASKENNIKSSFIWGYNKQYPIAQVTNADIKDIFHTSFEEGDGNSTIGDSKTGDKSKTNGFSVSLSNLTNGQYTFSYWQKNGASWAMIRSTVTVTNGTYNISLNGQVDEIRFHPQSSTMTTYTYLPLIGMATQCDVNSNIIYYKYDGFGRLIAIRDKDGNILKTFEYKYQETVQ